MGVVNCKRCGALLNPGITYCASCGQVQDGWGIPGQAQPGAADWGKGKSSSSKWVLVALLAVMAAGLAVGLVLAFRGGGERVDERVMGVWEDYQDLLEKDGDALKSVQLIPKYLWDYQAGLEESMEEAEDLQKDLKRISSSDLKGISATKCSELEDALDAYL